MLYNHMIVDQEDDCFYKMDQFVQQRKVQESCEEVKEESKDAASDAAAAASKVTEVRSRLAILHSRYASRKNTMRDK